MMNLKEATPRTRLKIEQIPASFIRGEVCHPISTGHRPGGVRI